MRHRRAPHRMPLVALALLAALGGTGCSTQRTLTIDSEPPGARIWVNGTLQRGVTPVEVPFTHYGRFDVRLEKAGYQSAARELHVPTELDGYPVVDLPLEMLTPEKRFRRVVRLEPLPPTPTDAEMRAYLETARSAQEQARREVVEPDTPGRQAPGVLRP